MTSYYSKLSWHKFTDLGDTRFRVSVRIPQLDNARYMVIVDLNQTPTVPLLVHHLCRTFSIYQPSSASIYRDRDRQLVLVLEPDILVHDLEAIGRED